MCFAVYLFLIFAVFTEVQPTRGYGRIVGGTDATIQSYPFAAAILDTNDQGVFRQICGGSILNQRSILTAAHCINPNVPGRYRARLGSSFASRGGMVYSFTQVIVHPEYNLNGIFDSDIAIAHTATPIIYIPTLVHHGSIAGPNYVVPDNASVTAIGWGFTSNTENTPSEQLQQVEVFKVNHEICQQRWFGMVTNKTMCTGILDVGGRGQCGQDSGGPVLHNDVIVGITLLADGSNCVSGERPNVSVRVSQYTSWIQNTA